MSDRRKFIQNTGMLITGSTLLSCLNNKSFSMIKNWVGANDQVNIGAIGINGMGWSNVKSAIKISGVNLVALCDVDKNVLDKRMAELASLNINASKVKSYGDYREMLADKDVDVVIIGTPDHWHALIMIEACEAGKDVYVEKPVGNSIEECRAMVAAQKRYNKVVQVGQWQRSQPHMVEAVEYLKTGKLGNIRTVKVWCYQGWMKPGPVVPDSAPPPGVDFTKWLGPAPMRSFNSSRFHFNFRWFWDYAGGLMTDWGVHLIDYALYGMNAGLPKTVTAIGGPFAYPELYQEAPDTMSTMYEFDKFNLLWDHAMGIDNGLFLRDHGISFIGNNGTLELDRSGWEVVEEKQSLAKVMVPRKPSVGNGLDLHWQNFIDAVRSNDASKLRCPIETGAHIATISQMGNIAFRSGKKLYWEGDAATGKFTDKKINKQYVNAHYHNGYELPK